MKNITILILILFAACTNPSSDQKESEVQQVEGQYLTEFSWLLGVWERSMSGDSSMNHFESWSIDSTGLEGTGTTIVGDEVTHEQMWIYANGDTFYYKAHPAQNEMPTAFTITEIKDSFFRCENNSHDFPKYIEYQCSGDSLFAYIGDETQRIAFKFKKQDERDFR